MSSVKKLSSAPRRPRPIEVKPDVTRSFRNLRSVEVGLRATLAEAIDAFLRQHGDLAFVQVGGFARVGSDSLQNAVAGRCLRGLVIEPLPQNFAKLERLYARSPHIALARCAIAEADGERIIWRFKPQAIEDGILDPHFAGMTSFKMDEMLSDEGSVGRLFSEGERVLLRSLVEPIAVDARTLASLLAEHAVERVDLLQVDTEGYDLTVLKSFDFARFRPAIVHFEHVHLNGAERAEAEQLLAGFGYRTFPQGDNTLAIRTLPIRRTGPGAGEATLDGLRGNVVFCAWTGDNALTPQRAEALLSIYRETCCPVMFLTPHNLRRWELPDHPFHPAYAHLSETHRADYLRVYLMHHFGGGYTDLKRTSRSWVDLFERLRATPEALGLGYAEIGPHGVARCAEPLGSELRRNYAQLIGNCAYIFRRRTEFTARWLDETHRVLDAKLPALAAHPARHPMDQRGVILPDGSRSDDPLGWSEMLGELFHPLVYAYRDRIIQADIAPSFQNYR